MTHFFTFRVGTRGYWQRRVALNAVRDGLAKKRTNQANFEGVAVFADYTTDNKEWNDYRRLWLGK
jgi:hypothetical protein